MNCWDFFFALSKLVVLPLKNLIDVFVLKKIEHRCLDMIIFKPSNIIKSCERDFIEVIIFANKKCRSITYPHRFNLGKRKVYQSFIPKEIFINLTLSYIFNWKYQNILLSIIYLLNLIGGDLLNLLTFCKLFW